MVNGDLLRKKGYEFYKECLTEMNNKHFVGLYQKYIHDNFNVLFYINIKEYDYSDNEVVKTIFGKRVFMASVQFIKKDGMIFDCEFNIKKDMTINQIEKFFIDMYDKMECIPCD